jgi:hypothetical protein
MAKGWNAPACRLGRDDADSSANFRGMIRVVCVPFAAMARQKLMLTHGTLQILKKKLSDFLIPDIYFMVFLNMFPIFVP